MVVIHYLQRFHCPKPALPLASLTGKSIKLPEISPHFFAFASTLGNGKMQKEVFSTFSQLLNGFPLKPFFTLAHSGVNQPFIREQLVFFQPLKNLLLTLVKRRGVFEQGLQSICLKRRQKITQKARSRSMIRSQRFRSKSWSPAHLGYSTSGKKFPQRGGWLLSHPDRGLQYY